MMCYICSHFGFGLHPGARPAGPLGQARPTARRRARGVHSSTAPRGARAGRARALAIGATENTGTVIRSRRHVRDARHSESLERERGSEAGVATDSQISVAGGARLPDRRHEQEGRRGRRREVQGQQSCSAGGSHGQRDAPLRAARRPGTEKGPEGPDGACTTGDDAARRLSRRATATNPEGWSRKARRRRGEVFGAMLKSRSTC
jgi:hypothetical protein